MSRLIVGIAELKTGGPENVLVTLGLGSCVVIALYEKNLRIGSLAHIMLPHKSFGRRREGENMNKYADIAIPSSVEELERKGGRRQAMTAKIAGGSRMFDLETEKQGDIGRRNVEAVKTLLAELDIPLLAEDTGGSRGRSVEFRIETGDLLVSSIHGGEQVI